jgi:esterase/lipase superfamily enzyme
MILVSCRQNFTGAEKFGGGLQARDYKLDPGGKNPPEKLADLTLEQLADLVRGKHALVIVHGYNTPFENVAPAYAQVEQKLRQHKITGAGKYEAVLGFLWPGYDMFLEFKLAIRSANQTAPFLGELLKLVNTNALSTDVQTHSLGARVALQTLKSVKPLWIDNLILQAPAVNDESLSPKQEFNKSLDQTNRAFAMWSRSDKALLGFMFSEASRALGRWGPSNKKKLATENPNLYSINGSPQKLDHGDYKSNDEVYRFWKRVVDNAQIRQQESLPA